MAPDGRDAVRSRMKELMQVGAMRIEPIRGESGRLCGKRWVLVTPDKWAVAAPLSSKVDVGLSNLRLIRSSENRTLRFTKLKGPLRTKFHLPPPVVARTAKRTNWSMQRNGQLNKAGQKSRIYRRGCTKYGQDYGCECQQKILILCDDIGSVCPIGKRTKMRGGDHRRWN